MALVRAWIRQPAPLNLHQALMRFSSNSQPRRALQDIREHAADKQGGDQRTDK
jgi:hypothetical protein